MAAVTVLSEKRREKQWKFERSVLRNLSLKKLQANVQEYFKPVVPFHFLSHPFLLDPCMDMAIDAFLLGAGYGKFGYLGESIKEVKYRCDDELTEITHCIFNLLQGWLLDSNYLIDSLKAAVEAFVDHWWTQGFQEGEKRYRLRLH
jgi:hypothetical protein